MKKLSLMLAFVLVFALVLVACGDETETSSAPETESSVAATESSEAKTEESSEAEVEESSEAVVEDSSEPEAESSEPAEESSKVEVTLGEVVSTGKSYTTTAPNRGDAFDDDGKKLTNGTKGLEDPGTLESAGWNSPDKSAPHVVEIVVDLGEAMETNAYTVYFAGGNWGIGLPNGETGTSIEIFVSDSADGEFTSVAKAAGTEMVLVSGDGESLESWSTFTLTAGASEPVNAQFVKFVLTAAPVGNAFIWIDEVEVYAPAE